MYLQGLLAGEAIGAALLIEGRKAAERALGDRLESSRNSSPVQVWEWQGGAFP